MDGHENNFPEMPDWPPEVIQMLLQVRRMFFQGITISLTYVTPVRVPQLAQVFYPWLFQGQPVQDNVTPSHPESHTVQQV